MKTKIILAVLAVIIFTLIMVYLQKTEGDEHNWKETENRFSSLLPFLSISNSQPVPFREAGQPPLLSYYSYVTVDAHIFGHHTGL